MDSFMFGLYVGILLMGAVFYLTERYLRGSPDDRPDATA